MKDENKLNAKLNVVKFPIDTTKAFSLSTDQDWVKDLLIELNEKADDSTPEENLKKTDLTINLEIIKKHKDICGDYILVKGHLETNYLTRCVRTLKEMEDSLKLEIKACFLDELYEEDEAYSDQDEIFQDDNMYDLYFYHKKFANLAEMIHEQIYLHYNQYPVADENAPLDWANEASTTKQ